MPVQLKTGHARRILVRIATCFVLAVALTTRTAVAGIGVGTGVGAPFATATVSLPSDGIFAWWNPTLANVTLDGSGNLSSLADQSGHGHALAQAVAGLRPGWTASSSLKGAPAVLFNGVSYLDVTFALPEPWTILFVAQTAAPGPGVPAIYDDTNCTNRSAFIANSPTSTAFPVVGVCTSDVGVDLGAGAVPSIAVVVPAGGNPTLVYVDGTVTPDSLVCGAFTWSTLRWGASCVALNFAQGPWTQGIIWNRALSPAEMSMVGLYATIFWGAT